MRRRVTGLCAFAAVLALRPPTARSAARGDEAASRIVADAVDSIARGLEQRQQAVTTISGEATDEHMFCDAYIESIRAHLPPQAKGPTWPTGRYDRGAFKVRFCLAPERYRYEVQPLVWPGEAIAWGFSTDVKRDPTEAYPYYHSVTCDGELIYSMSRGATQAPRIRISPLATATAHALQDPFGTWFGLALDWIPWSEALRNERWKVTSLTPVGDGTQSWVLSSVGEEEGNIGVSRTWIEVLDEQFCVSRYDVLSVNREDPREGVRVVVRWSDFFDPGLLEGANRVVELQRHALVSTRYTRDTYKYGPGIDSPWRYTRRTTLSDLDLSVADPLTETLVPVGAVLIPAPVPELAATQQRLYASGRAAWQRAKEFMDEPLPPDDPDLVRENAEFLKPLDGTELEAIRREHGL